MLDALRWLILVVVVVVTGLGALAGWLIARRATKPLVQLTDAAEEVATSGRLDVDVPPAGNDEPGRLARAFATMLAALGQSREQQQQLVQDAGHELRTPLTSLRTNVETLRRYDDLPEAHPAGHPLGPRDRDPRARHPRRRARAVGHRHLRRRTRADRRPRPRRRPGGRAGAASHGPDRHGVGRRRPTVIGRPRDLARADRQPGRQRGQVQRRSGAGGGHRRPRHGGRARSRSRHPGRRSRPGLPALLPFTRGPLEAGLGPRPVDRRADRPVARRHGVGGQPPGGGAVFTFSLPEAPPPPPPAAGGPDARAAGDRRDRQRGHARHDHRRWSARRPRCRPGRW